MREAPGAFSPRSARVPARRDDGSATVWVALVATVLCALFGTVLALGQVVIARHRAGAAADLAALAAADHALRGESVACARAAEAARAQGAVLLRCELRGEIADVEAASRLGPFTPTALSRAGPASPAPAPPGPAPPGPASPAPAGPAHPGPEASAPVPPAPVPPGPVPPAPAGPAHPGPESSAPVPSARLPPEAGGR
ncbi:flp pilus-assembly TadE/G-like family protein [Streptomyces qinzhouensis]|uniref:Flp pilus-assembly TadE/G-like family protein n=1 Tax=Streptomyces qinzhouensis TaxID=2599401 RepID=A0A5B8JTA6_9ACTN|nr:flp pilus-assembly TadE/G-like family protein [Streptomyces qinzhouensis]